MKEEKKFISPEIEIVEFVEEDIILTSGEVDWGDYTIVP